MGPLSRRPRGEQLWLWPTPILESFVGHIEDQQTLYDAMYAASKTAKPSIVIEEDAPNGPVTLMESLGFEVLVAPVRLRTSNGEVDVYELADRDADKARLIIQSPP